MANVENPSVENQQRAQENTKGVEPISDGAVKPAQTLPNASPTSVQHPEPEDAYLTGGRRNLQRRVLGLNVEAGQTQRPADQSPGLHSTGSFTGVATGETERKNDK